MNANNDQFEAHDDGFAGLAYADGVFETMRSHRGEIPLWPQHRTRLSASLARLGLDQPHWQRLERHLQNLAREHPGAVIKLTSYSAEAGRGYRRASSLSRVRVRAHPLPAPQPCVKACTAQLRLARSAELAGLKTLARVEQRIAATAAAECGADVALLRNRDGDAVSFSHGNLFLDYGGQLCTAPLSHGAVAGVIRGMLIERGPVPIRVRPIPYDQLFRAKSLLLTNAVRGVQSVTRLDSHAMQEGSVIARLQDWLATQGLPPINDEFGDR